MFTKPHLWTNRVSAYLPAVGSSFRGQRVRWQQLSHPHSILTAALRVGQWWATAQTIGGLEPPSLFLIMAYWAPKGLSCPYNLYTFFFFFLSSTNYLCEDTIWHSLSDPDLNSFWNCSVIIESKAVSELNTDWSDLLKYALGNS